MKKIILIILSAILLLAVGLFYYSNQGKEKAASDREQSNVEETAKKDVREVIWEQLPPHQKESIDGTWKDGKVSKIIIRDSDMATVKDASYLGKEVYLIDFPIKSMSSENNILVLADMNTFTIIGYGLND